MLKLNPIDCPVDLAMGDYVPRLPTEEIIGLHNSGLSTDEDGETIADVPDPEIPFGWHVIEADDLEFFI